MERTAEHTARAMTLYRELKQAFDSADAAARGQLQLNITDFRALKYLWTHQDAGPGELAGQLEISTAATTTVLDRLESHGYIHRSPHPFDRRRTTITVHGAVLEGPLAPLQALLRDVGQELEAMDPAMREAVFSHLRQLSATMRQSIKEFSIAESDQRTNEQRSESR